MENKKESAINSVMIEIDKINDEVIDSIREVKKDSEGYKILANSIKKDGQLYPITVRKLNATENELVDSKVKYGIIDGHHRFQIAKDSGQTEILANIAINENSDEIQDMILAFKLNNTNLRMTPIQKGEVISKLMKLYEQNGEKKSVGEIGEEIFGLKTAMAYRCLQAFKQSLSKSEDASKSIEKCDFKKLSEAFHKLPTDSNLKLKNTEEYVDQLNAIKEIESQLRFYKKFLLSKQGLKEQ